MQILCSFPLNQACHSEEMKPPITLVSTASGDYISRSTRLETLESAQLAAARGV